VRTLVARHPSLTRISFLAHSMGGLLSRYAIGVLYQPTSGTICGLQPCHFISMATPHMGCDAAGPAQVRPMRPAPEQGVPTWVLYIHYGCCIH
jgi:triacylglycerol esterase/lipase EstA (alpha/beta hydrolase family)